MVDENHEERRDDERHGLERVTIKRGEKGGERDSDRFEISRMIQSIDTFVIVSIDLDYIIRFQLSLQGAEIHTRENDPLFNLYCIL